MQTLSSSSSVFTVSSNTKNRKPECCDPKVRMAAGSGMKDIQALIPIVGSGEGRLCGRDHTTICLVGRTCVWKIWKKVIRTEREREAQRVYLLLTRMQQLQNEQQPLQKFTKSLYIVTHLGQLPFMLITQMARTWALKEDSVNTTIIHWYSTLPRNGRIHGLSKIQV